MILWWLVGPLEITIIENLRRLILECILLQSTPDLPDMSRSLRRKASGSAKQTEVPRYRYNHSVQVKFSINWMAETLRCAPALQRPGPFHKGWRSHHGLNLKSHLYTAEKRPEIRVQWCGVRPTKYFVLALIMVLACAPGGRFLWKAFVRSFRRSLPGLGGGGAEEFDKSWAPAKSVGERKSFFPRTSDPP